MTIRADTYYARTAQDKKMRPVLKGAHKGDVCVIGGGLAGLATALSLAERGKRVVVLEGRSLGWGASGRNGGFVLAGYAAGFDAVARRVGKQDAKTLFSFTRDAQSLIRRRVADYKIGCDLTDGHLLVSWYNEPDALRRKADFMAETLDIPVEFMPRDELRTLCRSRRYYDALHFPDYFHMHPLNYMMGMVQAIEQKGGAVFENSLAVRIQEGRSAHRVHTASGYVECAHIVYCGSAYFNGLDKRLQRSCLPVSTYVMVTEPIEPEKLAQAVRSRAAIRDTRWTDDYYRILPDNRLLWGGRVGLGRQVPANLNDTMMADLRKIYPQLAGVKAQMSWAGIMGYTVHKMPHIGQLRPRVWSCTNFGGNGLGPTTAGGEIIARAIAEEDEDYKLFRPFGFEWTGGPLGPLVAQAVYHSWGVRDWCAQFSLRGKG